MVYMDSFNYMEKVNTQQVWASIGTTNNENDSANHSWSFRI